MSTRHCTCSSRRLLALRRTGSSACYSPQGPKHSAPGGLAARAAKASIMRCRKASISSGLPSAACCVRAPGVCSQLSAASQKPSTCAARSRSAAPSSSSTAAAAAAPQAHLAVQLPQDAVAGGVHVGPQRVANGGHAVLQQAHARLPAAGQRVARAIVHGGYLGRQVDAVGAHEAEALELRQLAQLGADGVGLLMPPSEQACSPGRGSGLAG